MTSKDDLAKRQYQERARVQCLAWAMGRAYHNAIDDECCPDFSCCMPDLFEKDAAKRWETYHKHYGNRQ
jgi:hypothetical protein